jgi:hypothetical protein
MNITKEEKKLLLICGLGILLCDIVLSLCWVYKIKPDIFMSTGPQYQKVIIFTLNFIIGLFVLFFKKRLSILFFLNTIIGPLIFTFFWNTWLHYYPFDMWRYSFTNNKKTYVLHIEKNPDSYSISEIKAQNTDSLSWDTTPLYAKKGDRLEIIRYDLNYDTITDSFYTRFYTKRCDSLELTHSSREYDMILAEVSWSPSYYKKRGGRLELIHHEWSSDTINDRRERIDTVMFFYENKLIGFPKSTKDILVKKIDGF